MDSQEGSLLKDPLLRSDYVSQWECCGRWLLACRLLWMTPGQMACHHLASATCVILLLLFYSSSWLLYFVYLRLSMQLYMLCYELSLQILILWFTWIPCCVNLNDYEGYLDSFSYFVIGVSKDRWKMVKGGRWWDDRGRGHSCSAENVCRSSSPHEPWWATPSSVVHHTIKWFWLGCFFTE